MIDADDRLKKIAELSDIDLIGVSNLKRLKSFNNILNKYEKSDIAFFRGNIYDKIDYKKVWDKTKSIIAFGISYNQTMPAPDDMLRRGIISKCAYGNDYHVVLKNKAESMMQLFQNEIAECEYRIFVDTGVLSDRILAYCAGLGFYGKNNFIINEKWGSFVFYGHILIDISLKENDIFRENRCGNCELCAKACPTKAMSTGSGLLNYNQCISYCTQKGLDSNTFGHLYGCDICQDACPYNRQAPITDREDFKANQEEVYPLLENIAKMGREEYKRRYGCSSLYWRGYAAIKRNAENIIKNRRG